MSEVTGGVKGEPVEQFTKLEPFITVNDDIIAGPETYKIKRPLYDEEEQYYRTLVVACDIDSTLIFAPEETPETVKMKVQILNEILKEGAVENGIEVEFIPVTTKAIGVFFDRKTKSIYGKILQIHSQTIKDFDRPHQPKSTPMPMVLGENGAAVLEKSEFPKLEGAKWYKPYALFEDHEHGWGTHEHEKHALGFMKLLLTDLKLIPPNHPEKANKKFPYKLEKDNLSYLSLQMPDGKPMPDSEKRKILTLLTDKLKNSPNYSTNAIIKKHLVFETSGQDFDIFINEFAQAGKDTAIQYIIDFKRKYEGKRWFGREHILMLDDKVGAAGVAIQKILESGGRAGGPANADKELKKILNESGVGGLVAKFPIFIGACAVIYETIYGKPMPKSKIKEINQRLLVAINARSKK